MDALRMRIPGAEFVYIADREGFPYGRRTREEVRDIILDRTERIVSKFMPDLVVVACNTASQASLDALRIRFPDTLFVGTVPAVKPAAESTRTGVIAVMSTDRAAVDPYLDWLVERWARGVRVIRLGAQALVEFVERDFLDASVEDRRSACREALEPIRGSGADRVVLACTHFLHVADFIAEEAGPSVCVVDSREGVASRAAELVHRSLATGGIEGRVSALYATGASHGWTGLDRFARVSGLAFGGAL
ncbi:MAG TPA: aspartate/glutamate racemase family protein [Magnetospirillaceae bacterium]|nr:aspartate/glutamate racemase family protein [Magnetospirillaceae bacterium]